MHINDGEGIAYIKNTSYCFIYKKGNISIIHDVDLFECNMKIEDVNYLFEHKTKDVPKWLDDIEILNDNELSERMMEIDNSILSLSKEKDIILDQLNSNMEYKKMLYASGDSLVSIVSKVLGEMLSISINDIDIKKEDISFKLDDKKILVEVKGVNTNIKREYVSQVIRHIEDDANINNVSDDDMSKVYKGVLIINPYIKENIYDRIKKDFYSNSVINDIKYHDIFTIDTISLLFLYQQYKVKGINDLKKMILEKNYIKPNFSIIKKD